MSIYFFIKINENSAKVVGSFARNSAKVVGTFAEFR